MAFFLGIFIPPCRVGDSLVIYLAFMEKNMKATITGVGHYVPERQLTNADLEHILDTSDEWIRTRTGIESRRILDKDKGTSFMAVEAVKIALSMSNTKPEEIDLILTATITPDYPVPGLVAAVQDELGAKNAWGFDVVIGCSGFISALAAAAQFIESGRYKKVLVIGADKMSALANYEDRTTCVLFGDGAGAVLIEPIADETKGIQDFIFHMDGSGRHSLGVMGGGSLHPTTHETVDQGLHYVHQDGRSVFKRAVMGMSEVTIEMLEKHEINPKSLALIIPHQANYRIIDAVADRLGIDSTIVYNNISHYGNTTAATIPLALSEAYQTGRIQKEDWILLVAFGSGFSWGSILLKWTL